MLGGLNNVDFMNQEYRSGLCHHLQSNHIMVKHVFQTSCVEIISVITAFDIAIQLIIYPIQQLIITQNDYAFKSLQKNTSYAYYKAISKVKRKLQRKKNNGKQPLTQIITERFLLALRRIFHILDRNNNQLLTGNLILPFCKFLEISNLYFSTFQMMKYCIIIDIA